MVPKQPAPPRSSIAFCPRSKYASSSFGTELDRNKRTCRQHKNAALLGRAILLLKSDKPKWIVQIMITCGHLSTLGRREIWSHENLKNASEHYLATMYHSRGRLYLLRPACAWSNLNSALLTAKSAFQQVIYRIVIRRLDEVVAKVHIL
jgi:hypothetical protein